MLDENKIDIDFKKIKHGDYIIKFNEEKNGYTNRYYLIKQDNVIENKKEGYFVFIHSWENHLLDAGHDGYGYEYYVTINDLLEISDKLPKKFVDELKKLKHFKDLI